MFQNSWDTTKTEIRGKFIVSTVYIRKEERAKINNKKKTRKKSKANPKYIAVHI
jgi:hypothetical protein